MVPFASRKYFMVAIKFVTLIFVIVVGSFILYNGNFAARAAVVFLALSSLFFKIWRRRHRKNSKYDDVGYWSGLDNFEIGIDLHCFDDLDLDDKDDFEVLSGDYYNRRPYR